MKGLIIVASLMTLLLNLKPLVLSSKPPAFEFLGQATFSSSLKLQGKPVGGLSGLTYDLKRQVYYAISDDRSQKAPARFYTLKINLNQGKLTSKGVKIVQSTTLLDQDQKPFPPNQIDAEGIAISPIDEVWISSEGDAANLIPPFVRSFDLQGQSLKSLVIPLAYLPTPDHLKGVRNNRAFESLAISPNGRSLITGTENALEQDELEANGNNNGTPARILRYNLAKRSIEGEFVYITEPTPPVDNPKSSLIERNGLVELVALDSSDRFLSLERAFNPRDGFQIKLFEVSLKKAANLKGQETLEPSTLQGQHVAQKKLLLNLSSLPISLDNLEGMALGPQLPDGRQLLILVSDNNFSPLQITQFLAFALDLPN